MKFHSPLRYPGGKNKLSEFITLLCRKNHINKHYIEPYAGGASVALSLLINEIVFSIHINDIDKSIYAFWHSVINETDIICKKIFDTPVTIEEWKKQKEIQKTKADYSLLDLGFSTFFLNRTNRSGILKAGVIGGNKQCGKWKLDARYNKSDLITRIKKIALYKDRIKLYNLDAIEFINKLEKKLPKNTLFYFDPPYFNKGSKLYVNFYNNNDHLIISKFVTKIKNHFWILSYDNEEKIKSLYKNFRQNIYSINYSAGKANKGEEVIIYSNNLVIPEINNPTNKIELQNYCS